MKFFILSLLSFILFQNTYAQIPIELYDDKEYKEKLKSEFLNSNNDSVKAIKAFQLSYNYKKSRDLKSSKEYLDLGDKYVKNSRFLKGVSKFYHGYYELGTTDLQKTEDQMYEADSLLKSSSSEEAFRVRSTAWILLGIIQQLKGKEGGGLNAYIEHALPLAKQSKDEFTEGNANKFIGISLINVKERLKANGYFSEALKKFKNAKVPFEATRLEAIVEVSIILAENNLYLDQLQTSKNYLDEAYQILRSYPKSNAFILYYYPEGVYYDKQGLFQEAINSFNKGIELHSNNLENYSVNRLKYAKFESLRKSGKYQEAIALMKELLNSKIIFPIDRAQYYNLLADAYAASGNLKEAYNWSQKHIEINDSLTKAANKLEILNLENKYQTIEKEKKITELQAEKQKATLIQKNQKLLNWLFGVGALLLLVAFFYLYTLYKNNKRSNSFKIKEMNQQKEIQLSNAFIDGEEKERQRIAQDLHDGLGGSLSGLKLKLAAIDPNDAQTNLKDSILLLDNSIVELRRIARNMMPSNLLKSGLSIALNDLCASMSSKEREITLETDGISEKLSSQVQINLYRIVQELITNSIQHGKANHIMVQCIQNGNQILLSVEDNGKGFDTKLNHKIEGIGLQNVKNRVEWLKGKWNIESSPQNGTDINIELFV